jgi:hypothetical protein
MISDASSLLYAYCTVTVMRNEGFFSLRLPSEAMRRKAIPSTKSEEEEPEYRGEAMSVELSLPLSLSLYLSLFLSHYMAF